MAVDGVDTTRTTTNNVYEIWQMLGIEAARTALVKEITNTLEEQGLEVDTRHIMLVADLMTSKGYLQQIGRHGIAGTKTSVLARAARSEEHTSELQSRQYLVCRLLLEKKN